MFYRVTPNQTTLFATANLQAHAGKLHRTQEQMSTGIRLHRPSDDPIAIRRSLIQQDGIDRLNAHLGAMEHTEARLSQAHVQLREAHQLFVRAREIGLSARQTTNDSERKVLADELQGILNQFLSVANSADDSGYLFSGTATSVRPFNLDFNNTAAAEYSGSSDPTKLFLTNDVTRDSLLPGDRIFQPFQRDTTYLFGSSGAAIGTGVDTATGTRELLVEHTATTYVGATGIASGTSSVGGDTIIGPIGSHSITINDTSGTGAFGTVSLNGGAPVDFTNADTDLQVTGPNGEIVYVDTTAIVAGTSTTVGVSASGTLSIDGGATSQAISFSSNQILTDSRDGSVVNIDSTNVSRTATDHLEFPGTADAFRALAALRDELLNTRDLVYSDNIDAIGRRLDDIERIEGHLLDEIGTQSVALEQLDRLAVRTEDLQLNEELAHADTVSADLAQVAIALQEQLNLQQFTMATVGQLLSPSLLQFLN